MRSCGHRFLNREDGDVVILAKGLRGGGDCLRGLCADCAGAFETEELTIGVHGLDDAVGEKRETFAGRELKRGLAVFRSAG